MRLKEIINESLSSIVYHTTGIRNAHTIIANDEFILSADFAKSSESKGRATDFYLSTARSRFGAYHVDSQGYVNDYTVMFVLDGSKLNSRYSGAAVDYWQMNDERGIPMKDEMEDRLFSKSRSIPAKKYTRYVDILIDKNSGYVSKKEYLLHFYNLCKRKGFVLRVFDNKQDFLIGRNPVNPAEMLAARSEVKGFTGFPEQNRRYKSQRVSELQQLVAASNIMARGKIPSSEYTEVLAGSYGYSRDYYKQEVIRRIKNDMHNETRKPIMADMAMIMRRHRARDVESLLDAMLDQYNSLGGT